MVGHVAFLLHDCQSALLQVASPVVLEFVKSFCSREIVQYRQFLRILNMCSIEVAYCEYIEISRNLYLWRSLY